MGKTITLALSISMTAPMKDLSPPSVASIRACETYIDRTALSPGRRTGSGRSLKRRSMHEITPYGMAKRTCADASTRGSAPEVALETFTWPGTQLACIWR